jgi:hypothetical protein
MGLEPTEEFVQERAFKRRRFTVDESMESDVENTTVPSPFLTHAAQQKSLFSSNGEFLMVASTRAPCFHHHDVTSV